DVCAIAAQAPPPAGLGPSGDAPARAFDRLAQQCRDAFATRPLTEVAYAPARGAWVKRSYAPTEIQAQVQKTVSAVTPYVAQITVTETASAQPGEDFDTTRALAVPMDRNLLRSVRRLHFGFQEGQWTLMGAAVLQEVKADPATAFETVHYAALE